MNPTTTYNRDRSRLRRSLLFLATTGALLAQPQPQQGQLDASPTLFTVLAAINAAGYDADLESTAGSPLRKQLREFIASRHLESVEGLKRFFEAHQQKDGVAELSQYISFALTIDGPPEFESHLKPEEVPPDIRKLEGFNHLLARFYQEANVENLWKRARPAYDEMIAAYHGGVTRSLLEANAYLRNPTSGYRGRRFQIYVELLGAPNQIQTRSYKDDYFVIVTPSAEPRIEDIRHAYLHYLLDPLALRYFEQLNRLKGLADFAQPAPALDQSYKDDFMLFATECMIKAVESRLAPGAQKQALVSQALQEGFVLTPALADALAIYEKRMESLRQYYPDLITQIDLAREDKRLEGIQFAKQAAVKMVKAAPPPPEPALTGAAKTLADADDQYAQRDLERARQTYLKVLEQPGENVLHGKAYYGLARIATLKGEPELAEKLFQKTLELASDAETKSWAYLYLGRLADAAGERAEAEKNYRAALAIDAAPASVKAAAEKGLAQPFRREK
jgi:tetratricopeptide (TPR) repeat protein